MIIKSLELKNIRSYVDAGIGFNTGVTLLSGEYGSGKSTLLYAVEFALFGIPRVKSGFLSGVSLLRHGSNEGWVSLEFIVNNKEYQITRRLKRVGETVVQNDADFAEKEDDAWLVHKKIAVTELTSRVLEILGYPKISTPHLLFRYTIYTPQEQMRRIFIMNPEDRVKAFREAFQLEKYSNAAEMSEKLREDISREIRDDEMEIRGIGEPEEELKEQKTRLKKARGELEKHVEGKKVLEERIRVIKEDLGALKKQKERLNELEKAQEGLKAQLRAILNQIQDKQSYIHRLNEEIMSIKEEINGFEELGIPTEKPIEDLESELESRNKKYLDLSNEKAVKENMVKQYKQFESGVCPTCGQSVKGLDVFSKYTNARKELEEISGSLIKAEAVKKELEKLVSELGKYLLKEKEIQTTRDKLEDSISEVNSLKKALEELEGNKDKLSLDLEKIGESIEELAPLEDKLRRKEGELENAQRELNKVNGKIVGQESECRHLEERIATLESQLKRVKNLQEKIKKRNNLVRWLRELFIPTVKNIEQHVLAKTRNAFRVKMQEWYQLVAQDPEIYIDIDASFAPIVNQNGFITDVVSLSGGERTAVALAYRLALNNIINQLSALAARNLVVLDEPTDGFSRTQIARIPDILKEMSVDQVILVSHEKELENFASNIINVSKETGTSTITQT